MREPGQASQQSDAAGLQEALALSNLRLKETRAELAHLVRITERAVAEGAAQAKAERDVLRARVDCARGNLCSFIQLILEYDKIPSKVLMTWLVQSALFDPELYLRMNEDVAQAKFDAAEHFVRFGIKEGRPFDDAFSDRASA
jgi:hypothetical protein